MINLLFLFCCVNAVFSAAVEFKYEVPVKPADIDYVIRDRCRFFSAKFRSVLDGFKAAETGTKELITVVNDNNVKAELMQALETISQAITELSWEIENEFNVNRPRLSNLIVVMQNVLENLAKVYVNLMASASRSSEKQQNVALVSALNVQDLPKQMKEIVDTFLLLPKFKELEEPIREVSKAVEDLTKIITRNKLRSSIGMFIGLAGTMSNVLKDIPQQHWHRMLEGFLNLNYRDLIAS